MRYFHSNPKFEFNDWADWTHGPGPFQARRGDIQPILLSVLAERPMHGYEIIRYLEEKSHGFWRPSPGSVYPTLQLLEEQDLVTSHDQGGKKIYELTERGRSEAAAGKTHKAPWEWNSAHLERLMQMRTGIAAVLQPFKALIRTGSQEQVNQAVAIMNETGARLTALLEDAAEPNKEGAGA